MKKNVGTIDKSVRLVLVAVIVLLVVLKAVTGVLAYVLLALGVVLVLTSLISFCPLYLPFKISTRKKEQ